MVTVTAPGFGEMAPNNVAVDPTGTELGDADSVMLVGGRKNVAVNDPGPDETINVVGLVFREDTEAEPEDNHEENV